MAQETLSLRDLVVGPHHTAISCRDWDRTRSFFVDLLGFSVMGEIDRRDEPALGILAGLPGGVCRWAMLQFGHYQIEIIKWLTPEGKPIGIRQCDIGLTHVCIEVTDAEEVRRRIIAAGYEPISEVQSLRGGKAKPFYCYGPDGVVIEFLELIDRSFKT